jgi:hypothetical protein
MPHRNRRTKPKGPLQGLSRSRGRRRASTVPACTAIHNHSHTPGQHHIFTYRGYMCVKASGTGHSAALATDEERLHITTRLNANTCVGPNSKPAPLGSFEAFLLLVSPVRSHQSVQLNFVSPVLRSDHVLDTPSLKIPYNTLSSVGNIIARSRSLDARKRPR